VRLAIKLFLILVTMTYCEGALFAADTASGHPVSASPSTKNLKQYMANFGSMLASLEIIQMKEKKPDWPAIDIAIDELSRTLSQLQKADIDNAYKEYTDVLAAVLIELKDKSAKKDRNFFRSVDKLSETCFKCHAAHRPGDYLVPKEGKDQLSKDAAPGDSKK